MDAIDPSYVAPDVFDSADKMYRDDVGSVYSKNNLLRLSFQYCRSLLKESP